MTIIPVSFLNSTKDTAIDWETGQPAFIFNGPMTWADFRAHLEECTQNPYEDKEAAYLFSPTIYREIRRESHMGFRCRANATVSAMAVLDIDDDKGKELSFDDALANLREYEIEAILYTTASNREDYRFRVVIPFTEHVSIEVQQKAVHAICRVLMPDWQPEQNRIFDNGKLNCYSLFYIPGQYQKANNRYAHLKGEIVPASAWIGLDPNPQPDRKPISVWHENRDFDEDDLSNIIDAIPSKYAADYHDWVRVGMAIWNATGDFGLFDQFSSKANYNASAVRQKWKSYDTSRPTGVTMGTLIYLAREGGWERRPYQPPSLLRQNWVPGRGPQSLAELIASIEEAHQPPRIEHKGPKTLTEYISVRKQQTISHDDEVI